MSQKILWQSDGIIATSTYIIEGIDTSKLRDIRRVSRVRLNRELEKIHSYSITWKGVCRSFDEIRKTANERKEVQIGEVRLYIHQLEHVCHRMGLGKKAILDIEFLQSSMIRLRHEDQIVTYVGLVELCETYLNVHSWYRVMEILGINSDYGSDKTLDLPTDTIERIRRTKRIYEARTS